MLALKQLQTFKRLLGTSQKRWMSVRAPVIHDVDSCGIPLHPTWSVNQLLSSYPTPVIKPSTLKHLHALSALTPPEEGTPEHHKLKQEMEDLVRLVEAVKLVKLNDARVQAGNHEGGIPDSRIWAEGTGMALSEETDNVDVGQALMKHAARVSDGLYVVDAERRR